MDELIEYMRSTGVLSSPRIIEALEAVDRKDFVPKEYRSEAYEDHPLPIGEAQTISQSSTVAFMLELLELEPGQKVLDIGSGSGWTTALLAHIVGKEGKVIGLERIPQLVELGRNNLATYSFSNAEILQAGEHLGLMSEAPFDRILVSAAARALPDALVDQLPDDGILVLPVRHTIWKVRRQPNASPNIEKHEGFVFVPLV